MAGGTSMLGTLAAASALLAGCLGADVALDQNVAMVPSSSFLTAEPPAHELGTCRGVNAGNIYVAAGTVDWGLPPDFELLQQFYTYSEAMATLGAVAWECVRPADEPQSFFGLGVFVRPPDRYMAEGSAGSYFWLLTWIVDHHALAETLRDVGFPQVHVGSIDLTGAAPSTPAAVVGPVRASAAGWTFELAGVVAAADGTAGESSLRLFGIEDQAVQAVADFHIEGGATHTSQFVPALRIEAGDTPMLPEGFPPALLGRSGGTLSEVSAELLLPDIV